MDQAKGKIDNSALRFSTLDIISRTDSAKADSKHGFPNCFDTVFGHILILAISGPQYDRSTETVLSERS